FCAFNILNEIYRDTPHKTFGIPLEEYMKIHGDKALTEIKYARNKEFIEKMKRGEPYKRRYAPVLNKIRENNT
ncbi:MAG: radical SAM protein, partial [Ignisphaera sp.]